MAWSAPMTAVANTAFTAAQFNTYVRDNLNETAPAKASTAGGYFVVTGTNLIAERVPDSVLTDITETTTSTSYVDLATVGPAVTLTTGTKALVSVGGEIGNTSSTTGSVRMSVAVSGATSRSASDNWAYGNSSWPTTGSRLHATTTFLFENLTPGVNTFTCKYRVGAGTGTYRRRMLSVIPF